MKNGVKLVKGGERCEMGGSFVMYAKILGSGHNYLL